MASICLAAYVHKMVLPGVETLRSLRTRLASVLWYGKIFKTDWVKTPNNDLIMFFKKAYYMFMSA